jgi:exodeoxyribonuclease-3
MIPKVGACEKIKPIVVCGDLNVAHKDFDLARPKENYNKTAGYTQEEIDGMNRLVLAVDLNSFFTPVTSDILYFSQIFN